jgi:hypothetical protein
VHWLVLIPYYFFSSMTVLALLMVLCRLVRVKADINVLVGLAIVLALLLVIAPLALDLIDLVHLKALPLLALGLSSFVLAALDAALARVLPLPFDRDLQEL